MSTFVEPWVPAMGDLVQVRISAECSLPTFYDLADEGFIVDITVDRNGHDLAEDGMTGEVILVDTPADAHRFLVYFDQPVLVTGIVHPQASQFYAAAELEPLTPPRTDAAAADGGRE